MLPTHKREDAAVQEAHLAWGRERSRRWLGMLDENIIGTNAYLCGNEISIADCLGIGMLSVGEVAQLDYAQGPNLTRWIATMKARPTWAKVNEGFCAYFVAPYKDAPFKGL